MRASRAWLAAYTELAEPPLQAFTADALAAYLDELEPTKAPATVKKERAALNRLARYLHTLGAIDATEILMVGTAGLKDSASARDALDADTYARVSALARARLIRNARTRTARPTAARDHALILVLGDMGLRSDEARSLLVTSIAARRSDGLRRGLTVIGKGYKVCRLPIPTDVDAALLRRERERPPELADDELLFPRLGRPRRDGAFPDAAASSPAKRSRTSSNRSCSPPASPASSRTPTSYATPTAASSWRNGGELSKLQALMGHAPSETTSLYVHHTREDLEAAVTANESGRSLLEAHADQRRRRASSAD